MKNEIEQGRQGVPERIKDRYPQMSRTQRRIADYILDHTDEVCFQSLKEVSTSASTTETTMLKFCALIGYEGFTHFKRELQVYVKQRMSPSETLGTNLRMVRGDPQLYHRLIAAETRSLDLTYAAISPENMEAFVSALGDARRIYVVGHHISELVGRYLTSRLQQIGLDASMMEIEDFYSVEQTVVLAEEDDLFVVIAFPHYFYMTQALVDYLGKAGRRMVCITDRYSAPIAARAAAVLVCNSDLELFYNSITAAASLVNVVASLLVMRDTERFEAHRRKSEEFRMLFREGANGDKDWDPPP